MCVFAGSQTGVPGPCRWYGDSFFYTGQELEAATGLYDYHARIYDPETGRFLQPDPVHTENAGMDNWDRYAYVNGNPVNFTDPSGMSTNYSHMMNQIMRNAFHSFNHFTKGAIHASNSFVKGAVHSFNYLFPHKKTPEQRLKDQLGNTGMAILGGALGPMALGAGIGAAAAGLGLAGAVAGLAGGLALAAVAVVTVIAVSTMIAAVTLAASIALVGLAAASFACLFVGYVACAGYVLGGVSGSSWNHLRWNEQKARDGFGLGMAAQVVVGGILCSMVPGCAALIPQAWGAFDGWMQAHYGYHILTASSMMTNDVEQMRWSFLGFALTTWSSSYVFPLGLLRSLFEYCREHSPDSGCNPAGAG